jgi:thiol-disulfide isomerase/thioredoxin
MHAAPDQNTLQARLDALCASRREIATWNAAYEQILATLNHNGFFENCLGEGAEFPDFVLPNAEGRLISLRETLARGPVVLSFFRGEWCPFCRLMLAALTEALPEIEAEGATLLALTPETGGLALTMKTFGCRLRRRPGGRRGVPGAQTLPRPAHGLAHQSCHPPRQWRLVPAHPRHLYFDTRRHRGLALRGY